MVINMKKSASLICAALITIAAVMPTSASSSKWTAGNGYLVDDKNSPVTVTETDKGIEVSHGGYYTNGQNWGGVVYNEKVELDGFSVEISIDELPDTGTDTWFSVDFLQKPQLFQVGDFASNKGIVNLVRFLGGKFENYGPSAWANAGTDANDAFKLEEGGKLTVSVAKKGGKYYLTVNGVESATGYDLTGIADDGKAYLVISASMKDSNADNGFVYTITKLNGESTAVKKVETTTAAKTSDMGLITAAVCLACAAGMIAFSKKSKRV